jgi:exopolyphosphatase/pppGpp-phosphohydrolase
MNVPESRADIFPAATTILCAALDHLGCEQLHFSSYNLRYGLAAEMLEGQ